MISIFRVRLVRFIRVLRVIKGGLYPCMVRRLLGRVIVFFLFWIRVSIILGLSYQSIGPGLVSLEDWTSWTLSRFGGRIRMVYILMLLLPRFRSILSCELNLLLRVYPDV